VIAARDQLAELPSILKQKARVISHARRLGKKKMFTYVITRLLLISGSMQMAASFSWGTSQCSSPSHASRRAVGYAGLKVYQEEDYINISSEVSKIKGFLISGKAEFTDIPDHAKITDVCGSLMGAVCHSDSTPRESVRVRFRCLEKEVSVDISIYVVFGYKEPYVHLSGRVRCSSGDLGLSK
jgi:hypothetical protein